MAAPEFVPTPTRHAARSYSSPPWRAGGWEADRPGELRGGQPSGDQLGNPGPDQGYALTLTERFRGKLALSEGEHEADALTGAAAIAMKRSALFGRAPVIHDVRVGLMVWGFLDVGAPAELVEIRKEWFSEIHHTVHHYPQLRRVVDAVPEHVLRQPHGAITAQQSADWRSVLDLSAE